MLISAKNLKLCYNNEKTFSDKSNKVSYIVVQETNSNEYKTRSIKISSLFKRYKKLHTYSLFKGYELEAEGRKATKPETKDMVLEKLIVSLLLLVE